MPTTTSSSTGPDKRRGHGRPEHERASGRGRRRREQAPAAPAARPPGRRTSRATSTSSSVTTCPAWRVDREGEPVVGVVDDQVDEQQRGEVAAVGREAADVDLRVLDLPPPRVRARPGSVIRVGSTLGGPGQWRGYGEPALWPSTENQSRSPPSCRGTSSGTPSPAANGRSRPARPGPTGRRARRPATSAEPARRRARATGAPGQQARPSKRPVEPVVGRRQAGRTAARRQPRRASVGRCSAPQPRPIRTRRPAVHQSPGSDSTIASGGVTAGSWPGRRRRVDRGMGGGVTQLRSATSVLALVLAELPLPRQEPEGVGDLGPEAGVEVPPGAHRLKPPLEIEAQGHRDQAGSRDTPVGG